MSLKSSMGSLGEGAPSVIGQEGFTANWNGEQSIVASVMLYSNTDASSTAGETHRTFHTTYRLSDIAQRINHCTIFMTYQILEVTEMWIFQGAFIDGETTQALKRQGLWVNLAPFSKDFFVSNLSALDPQVLPGCTSKFFVFQVGPVITSGSTIHIRNAPQVQSITVSVKDLQCPEWCCRNPGRNLQQQSNPNPQWQWKRQHRMARTRRIICQCKQHQPDPPL